VREESHLDDMRSAIRGDFERLEQRRGAQELMHVAPAAAAEPEERVVEPEGPVPGQAMEPAERTAEPAGEHVPTGPVHRAGELPIEAVGEAPVEGPVVDGPVVEEPAGPDRRSWLARLLSR
jgi:hypothetical protein